MKFFQIITCSALLCILFSSTNLMASNYKMVGDVEYYEKNGSSLVFKCKNGKTKISFLNKNIVRVQMTPYEELPKDDLHLDENGPYAVVKYDWDAVDINISELFDSRLEGMIYKIEAGDLILKIRKSPFKIVFCDKKEKILAREKEGLINAGLGYKDSIVYETMYLPDDEHFFGFGGYKNPLDMRGHNMKCYSTELGELNQGGGFPVPFFMSNKGYGIFFNNLDDDVTFEMGTLPGEYSFYGPNGNKEGWHMDYYFVYGPSFSQILEEYIKIVGQPLLPEKWFFGHISIVDSDPASISINPAIKYREMDIPLDVIVFHYRNLKDDSFEYSDLFTKDFPLDKKYSILDSLGIKTIMAEALFTHTYDWKRYDPTQPEIVRDYWDKHKKFVNVDAWWQDNAEHFHDFNGNYYFSNGYENHQLFGALWAKNIVEGFEKSGKYGRSVISRSGAIGGHRYIIPWPGDIYVGIDYMDTDLDFIRNLGLTAFPYSTVDLGGYYHEDIDTFHKEVVSDDNVIRRMINLMPIIPISRSHGHGPKAALHPWNLSEKQQNLFRDALKLRYRLHPYIYSAAIEGHLKGRPILAPLVFDYQNNENTYDKDYHFMFGRNFLAAPVIKKQTEQWAVYLPEGEWVHYWTDHIYQGDKTVIINAPIFDNSGLPLFVKRGSIIPMMEDMKYINEKEFDKILWDIFPSKQSNYYWYNKRSANPRDEIDSTKIICMADKKGINIEMQNPEFFNDLIIHIKKSPKKVFNGNEVLKKVKNTGQLKDKQNVWYFGKSIYHINPDLRVLYVKTNKSKKTNVKIVY